MKFIKSTISEFCEGRGIPENIRDAFSAYMRSVYADRYMLRHDTDTVRIMINRLTEEQLEQAWLEFVQDLKRFLIS